MLAVLAVFRSRVIGSLIIFDEWLMPIKAEDVKLKIGIAQLFKTGHH
jgi:hypothetical protein